MNEITRGLYTHKWRSKSREDNSKDDNSYCIIDMSRLPPEGQLYRSKIVSRLMIGSGEMKRF